MPTEKPRVTFTISKEKLSELESYQHENRIKNQTQAILSLIDKGISEYLAETKKSPPYTEEALKLAKDYDDLDGHGKKVVRLVADEEKARCTAPAPAERPQHHRSVVILHRPFTQVAAAEGAGAFLLDSNYDEVTVELNRFTQKADIILKVVGRSMEPEIHDGDHILVREQPSVEEGEIGVFIIDGNGFLKQAGPGRLISLNHDIEDVIITNQQTAECYGKYICVLNPEWVVE